MNHSEQQTRESRFRLMPFLGPYRGRLALLLAILLTTTALGLAQPWLVQQLIDRVLLGGRADLIWVFPVAVLSIALFRFGLGVIHASLYASVTARVLLDMRVDFLEHLQKMSPYFFTSTRFGEVIIRLNRDLTQLQELSTGALLGFVTHLLTIVGVIIAALLYAPGLFLICALPFPVALAIGWAYRGPIRRLTEMLRTLAANLASQLMETLSGIRTVRTHGRERGEIARFLSIGHPMVRGLLSFQRTRAFASGLPRLCLVVSSAILYTVGGMQFIRGELQLGELVALGLYLGIAFAPLQALVDLYLQLVQGKVALGRVREMRDVIPEIEEGPDARDCPPLSGEVIFEEVHFRHQQQQPLLEGVDLSIEAGQTVALVGESGSGKSTLVDLLLRFLDPKQGRILVDGHDLRDLVGSTYRRQLAVVPSDTFLFHATVMENIRFGRPLASDKEVIEAASRVRLPGALGADGDGMETVVGERGERLSAGQRQRVGIARALLRKPKILILDEATAHLDLSADRKIRETIAELMTHSTTLLITHRLSSLADVDRILVLDGGKIIEDGAPSQLMRAGTVFQEMVESESEAGEN